MKVLHVNAMDIAGGAARAAYRIHRGIQDCGVDSYMMVWQKSSDDPNVICPFGNAGLKLAQLRASIGARICKLEKYPPNIYKSANIFPSCFVKAINDFVCDIVHLHWIGAELIQIEQLPRINKPVVWTHHDGWAYCGCCHHDLARDGRNIDGYTSKNRPASMRGLDIDRWVWRRKFKAWQNLGYEHVTPSDWLRDSMQNSRIFRDASVQTIHNGLDILQFSPIDKTQAKLDLKLDPNSSHILFGAAGVDAIIKGFDLLIEALKKCQQTAKNIALVVFGAADSKYLDDIKMPCRFLDHLDNDGLRKAYSAADVMVVPSRMESFGQTASEALACGTPVVAFDTTGLKDIVLHETCGYLAKPFNTDELARGINWVLGDESRHASLCLEARRQAEEKFDIRRTADKYYKLYERILKKKES